MASKVLIVDDDELAVELMVEALTTEGLNLISSTNETEAISILEREPPDLLATDVYMPGMRGQELVRRARAIRPGLAALVITGWSEHINSADWVELTDCALLYKPFTITELRAAVAGALEAAH